MLGHEIRIGTVDVIRGFANNLDIAHNRVLSLQVFLKRLKVFERLNVGSCARNSLGDMNYIIL